MASFTRTLRIYQALIEDGELDLNDVPEAYREYVAESMREDEDLYTF